MFLSFEITTKSCIAKQCCVVVVWFRTRTYLYSKTTLLLLLLLFLLFFGCVVRCLFLFVVSVLVVVAFDL